MISHLELKGWKNQGKALQAQSEHNFAPGSGSHIAP